MFTSTDNNIVNVDIAMINGNIHVVWEDSFSGTVKYRRGTYGTVGLTEDVSTEAYSVNIYPNPATSFVEINIDNTGIETMRTIFAADGSIVNTLSINRTTKVNTSTMPSGLYFLSFKNETEIVVKELIVK